MNLEKRLDNLRRSKGLTWDELGGLLEVSRTMVHYLRQGERQLSVKTAYRLRQLELEAGLKSEPLAEHVGAEPSGKGGVNRSKEERVLLRPAGGEPMYSIHEQPGGQPNDDPELNDVVAALEYLKHADSSAYKHMVESIMFCRERAAHKTKAPPKKKPSSKKASSAAELLDVAEASSDEPPKSPH